MFGSQVSAAGLVVRRYLDIDTVYDGSWLKGVWLSIQSFRMKEEEIKGETMDVKQELSKTRRIKEGKKHVMVNTRTKESKMKDTTKEEKTIQKRSKRFQRKRRTKRTWSPQSLCSKPWQWQTKFSAGKRVLVIGGSRGAQLLQFRAFPYFFRISWLPVLFLFFFQKV